VVFTFSVDAHRCPGETLAVMITVAVVRKLLTGGFDPSELPEDVTYRASVNPPSAICRNRKERRQMTDKPRLWMRHEVRPTERRAPIVPEDARRLVEHGIALTVEDCPQRVFPISDYAAAGCAIAEPGGWTAASADHYVIGLELPDLPAALSHRHVFFGHAYKEQWGGRELLRRFAAGGGVLLDTEYLVDAEGRRLAGFGYWAGYVGAALAVLHLRDQLNTPLRCLPKEALDDALGQRRQGAPLRALVIGALGRGGRGARGALATATVTPTCWDIADTRQLDRTALLGHDLLVNTVLSTHLVPPFLTHIDLAEPTRRLTLISDVTCDVNSACNVLPIYDSTTTWEQPVRRLRDGVPPLDILAIDNLPSLLPTEASWAFSAELLPHLMSLGGTTPTWWRCERTFHEACLSTGIY
jgi:saccharopine dehydrogenase (NAD+, L-lysine forming)